MSLRRKALGWLLSLTLALGMVPAAAMTAFAADTRIEVASVTATSNTSSIPVYGATVERPTFTVTEGAEARFATSNGGWYVRGEGGTETRVSWGDKFAPGTYFYYTQVRVDGAAGSTHVLGFDATVTVDGVEWDWEYGNGGADYSYGWVTSPDFVIEAPADVPLTFYDNASFDIDSSYVNEAIGSFSLAGAVSGGVEPYTFSKVSGPEWISVSAAGIVSGTPTAVGENADLVVCVTDAADPASSAEITIAVDETRSNPSDREVVTSIVASSNISEILAFGAPTKLPTFTVTEGEGVRFANLIRWQKKNDDGTWSTYLGDTFVAGTYRFPCQVRIDGDAGYTHVLGGAGSVDVVIDGLKWDYSGASVGDDLSYSGVISPEFRIYDPAFEAFTDVPEGAWFYNPVAWAVSNGITSGLSATEFGPNATCTRAQAVTFLWNAAGKPAPSSTDMPFTDVKAGAWYRDAVLWAVEQGITSGTSATTFSPNATCTRAQIVTFIWNSEGKPAPSAAATLFADVKAGAWYFNAVLWAVEEGVTAGTSPITFSPNAKCTRAQIVTFMYNYMG